MMYRKSGCGSVSELSEGGEKAEKSLSRRDGDVSVCYHLRELECRTVIVVLALECLGEPVTMLPAIGNGSDERQTFTISQNGTCARTDASI